MGIILASASPRRKELLGYIVNDFKIVPSDVEEIVPKGVSINKHPEFLSKLKAIDISKRYPNDTVIGADTAVIIKNKILGKPVDREDAFNMLSNLSGKTHKVITGCTVVKNGVRNSFSVVSRVKFCRLTKTEILAYLDTREPYDKAGSYAVQGMGGAFVEYIIGDYFNIVGLPISKLKKYI